VAFFYERGTFVLSCVKALPDQDLTAKTISRERAARAARGREGRGCGRAGQRPHLAIICHLAISWWGGYFLVTYDSHTRIQSSHIRIQSSLIRIHSSHIRIHSSHIRQSYTDPKQVSEPPVRQGGGKVEDVAGLVKGLQDKGLI